MYVHDPLDIVLLASMGLVQKCVTNFESSGRLSMGAAPRHTKDREASDSSLRRKKETYL